MPLVSFQLNMLKGLLKKKNIAVFCKDYHCKKKNVKSANNRNAIWSHKNNIRRGKKNEGHSV